MKISKLTAFITAAACIGCFTGCGQKSKNDTSEKKQTATEAAVEATMPVVGGDELTADNFDEDKYLEKVNEKVKDEEASDKPVELGSVGDIITPAEGSQEVELGDYRISDSGVKLYYDENEFPTEMVLTLEKFFTAFSTADYSLYTSCVFPSYVEEMEKFLKKDYDYDLKTSFATQCARLASQMKGDYKITRVKVEPAEQYKEGEDNIDGYFSNLDSIFETDFYERVKSESDELIDACFYVMAEGSDGKESMLVSECEIVFAVKDGKYYTFG